MKNLLSYYVSREWNNHENKEESPTELNWEPPVVSGPETHTQCFCHFRKPVYPPLIN